MFCQQNFHNVTMPYFSMCNFLNESKINECTSKLDNMLVYQYKICTVVLLRCLDFSLTLLQFLAKFLFGEAFWENHFMG